MDIYFTFQIVDRVGLILLNLMSLYIDIIGMTFSLPVYVSCLAKINLPVFFYLFKLSKSGFFSGEILIYTCNFRILNECFVSTTVIEVEKSDEVDVYKLTKMST